MSEIIACIREGRKLVTSSRNFYRDYIHPKDLCRIVELCIEKRTMNAALDAYSRRPVRKFELIDHFVDVYGLRYRIVHDLPETSPTGPKSNYYSNNIAAAEIGYAPEYESMDAIAEGAAALLRAGVAA